MREPDGFDRWSTAVFPWRLTGSREWTREPACDIQGRFHALDFRWDDEQALGAFRKRVRKQDRVVGESFLHDVALRARSVNDRAVARRQPHMSDHTVSVCDREGVAIEGESRLSGPADLTSEVGLVNGVARQVDADERKDLCDESGTTVDLWGVVRQGLGFVLAVDLQASQAHSRDPYSRLENRSAVLGEVREEGLDVARRHEHPAT